PNRLYSPHTVVLRQSGHCFELATVLCSLLIGFGYDAYVVSGYATQDVCLKIMTRVDSPFPPEEEEKEEEVKHVLDAKYMLRPAKDLRSKFLLAMAQREVDRANAEKEKQTELERQQIAELEKPPFDELYGLRVHAWVLLLPGERYVEAATFIEPSTGTPHPLNSLLYCGIESIWNNNNYWVNLQDCSAGLEKLGYDFSNLEKWEHFLIGEPLKWREAKFSEEMEEDEIQLLTIMDEKHLDMPSPWSLRISIPHSILKQRFPQGVKKTWYKRTMTEQFAPYVQEDGLVTRICRYNDLECTPSELHTIEERFENRTDSLVKTISDIDTGDITEYFERGREDGVKKHSYKCGHNSTVEAVRVIEFYHEARYDGLTKLELDAMYLTEHYVEREDRIYYRHVNFAKRGEPPPGMIEGPRRIVVKIVEKYHRNEKKPASKDIAVREFAIIDREIHLKHHYEEGKVTASTRDFVKPPLAEMGEALRFNPNLTVGYQAEVGAKPPRQLQLFLLFEQQLEEEEQTLYHIREMEDQVLEFLKLRNYETAYPKLSVSLFDREHNIEHTKGLREREQKEKEHKEREVEDEVDYLAPYISRLGNPAKLTLTQAQQARDWCLLEFKQMLVDRANDIQQQFEYVTTRLQEKQNWYVTVQDTLRLDEETRYFDEVNESTFLLNTLEIRLVRHRDLSPYRYEALETFLMIDPRLRVLYK
ncbi:hypothetical protein ILUMI_06398, partial [Ignelater luminosus]